MIILFLITLFGALIIGLPVALSLLFSGASMMASQGLFSPPVIAQQVLSGLNGFTLLAMPFFILAGEAMNKGGISEAIVKAILSLVGHIRGALGYVVIFSCMIFAGLSGSAAADTACMGGVLLPMMLKDNYNRGRATGLLVCSAIMANIIPPSIGFILFGIMSGASITRMFMGGIIPGLIFAFSLMVTWFFVARKDKLKPYGERVPIKESSKVVFRALPALLLPILIIVGLRGGVFTPTEAGAIAAAYALIVGAFVFKKIKWKDLPKLFLTTVWTTAKITIIISLRPRCRVDHHGSQTIGRDCAKLRIFN